MINVTIPSNKPEKIFGLLFGVRDFAHKEHLLSKSYAQHVALGDFYESILELSDELIESYQGKYGLLKFNITEPSSLKEFVGVIDSYKFNESYLDNQLDEIRKITYKTIYKLDNLR